ncbi:MAG: NAD(P)/FAD-dependent oxidoreductase, partial [Solirubrobacteraceae bacterium]
MPSPWPQSTPSPAHKVAYADAVRRSFWLDTLPARDPHAPLDGQAEADLCIVGGGYTGLWAALYAKALDPAREVVLLEATRCGAGASGRNGGFLQSSLTHGIGNGLSRFPDELVQLERLWLENFRALAEDLERLAIDAEFEPAGDLIVALEPRELADLDEEAALLWRFGHDAELLDRERVRAEVNSPTYVGGLWTRTGSALVHAGKLADGLRAAAARDGVRIHEYSPVRALRKTAGGVCVTTDGGVVDARRVLLATSAYPPLLRAIGRYIAPVYDYVLVTEPLDARMRDAVGWGRRQGVSDLGNQFHYYRPTADWRILWGGYDAV